MILLSKKDIPPNFGLLYDFLRFWSTVVNAFILPFGMMSPTLHDVATIVGLLVDRDEVLFFHNILDNDLGFQVNKKSNAYSTFFNTFNRGSDLVGEIEHRVFLFF